MCILRIRNNEYILYYCSSITPRSESQFRILKLAMKIYTCIIKYTYGSISMIERVHHRSVDLVRNIRSTRASRGDRPRNLINAGKGPLKKPVPWK